MKSPRPTDGGAPSGNAGPDPTRGGRPADVSGASADFFDDAYCRLLAPFHTEADARHETAALRELLELAQRDRVLDLGCGWGRHLRLLAGAGHDVVGLDLSVALLRRARTGAVPPGPGQGSEPGAAGPAGAPARLVAGDMRRLPLAAARFDVVLNLATSLGLFLEDVPAVAALREARRVTRAGGRLLLEGMHRDDVEPDFAARDRWTLPDGTEVRARRRWDPRRGVSHEAIRWAGPTGRGRKRHSLRIRTADETARLLTTAGWTVVARYGDWSGEPFDPASPRLIVVAESA